MWSADHSLRNAGLEHQLFMNLSKARRKVFFFYIILSEFHVPVKLVRLTGMCLNKIYNVSVAKHVSDLFHTQNCLKEGKVIISFAFSTWL